MYFEQLTRSLFFKNVNFDLIMFVYKHRCFAGGDHAGRDSYFL